MRPLAQLVTVTATDGLQLPGLWYQPARPAKRAVISLHGNGTGGSFYGIERTNTVAAALTKAGVAYLALNNRGAHLAQRLKFIDEAGEEQKRTMGTSHELIADCHFDIDGAAAFAQAAGYTELYLLGHSTGANKICVYNYHQPQNPFAGYILFGGGDDTGIYYEELGSETFQQLLAEARDQTEQGRGEDLVPAHYGLGVFSYQSIYDTINPDGDYNVFAYYEAQAKTRLSTKPLFRHYRSIAKPTLVIYGDQDEFCRPTAAVCMEILKKQCPEQSLFDFKLIPGADHGASGKYVELAHAIKDWIARQSNNRSNFDLSA